MRVCIVSREYPPFFGGGIGTYARTWARVLADAGHEVAVLTVGPSGSLEETTENGHTVLRIGFIHGGDWSALHPAVRTRDRQAVYDRLGPFAALSMLFDDALSRFQERFSWDVIEGPDTGALLWWTLNRRRTEGGAVPAVVTHVHSPTEWIERWNRSPEPGGRYATLKLMERDTVRWADAVVTPSHAMAEWVDGAFGVRPRAIPLPVLSEPAPPPGSADPPPLRVLFVGRAEVRKGIDTLIAAVAQCPDVHLDIAGEDTTDVRTGERVLHRALQHWGSAVAGRVVYHGKTAPDRLGALRAGSHLAAVPSPTDNFPYACVEAMAAGLPVLAACAGGMAEMVRDGQEGFLFQPDDPADCARALRRACATPPDRLGAMGRDAARRIASLCDPSAVLDRRLAHYTRAIAARTAPAEPAPAVVLFGAGTDEEVLEHLRRAVARGRDFAHGWARVAGRLMPSTTPTPEALLLGPSAIGPIAVHEDLLAVVEGAASSWEAAWRLACAGHDGAVVPACVTDSRPVAVDRLALVRACPDAARRVAVTLAACASPIPPRPERRGWHRLRRLAERSGLLPRR